MTNSGVAIKYGNIAPDAKENFVPSVSDKTDFSDLSIFQKNNVYFRNLANPCELYSVALDGSATAFPSFPENENIGLWSKQISGDDGIFASPIVLTLSAEELYSSQGLTLTFDTYNNIFANSINIKWYENDTLISDMDFSPDSAFYYCENSVEGYNNIVITFNALNMPYNRLKLRSVDYGYGTWFYGDELKNVKIIQEVDPISSEIAINTCDFTLDSKSDTQYSFQVKQPLNVYFNGDLKSTTFVKKSKRTGKRLWQIQSEDYVGLLDGVPFFGGIYEEKNAVELLEEIFEIAKVPYIIDSSFNSETVTGRIPYTTCREALTQVAFAIQAVVDTSNSEFVNVRVLEDQIKQTIPLNRIMQGQNFADEDTVTSVEISCHSYNYTEEEIEAYKAEENGTGNDILVIFSEPLHSLSITQGAILSYNANYARISASEGCILTGQKYEHIKSIKKKNNPAVNVNDVERVVKIEDATLVSVSNIDKILEKCYNWIVKTNVTNLRIVEGKHIIEKFGAIYGESKYGESYYGSDNVSKEIVYDMPVNVGDMIESETEYLGTVTGRIIKQTFGLNGGIIIKEAVLK